MENFVILHDSDIPGAVVGTDKGTVIHLSEEQFQNTEWVEEHRSDFDVFKFEQKDQTIDEMPAVAVPGEKISQMEGDAELEPYEVRAGDFQVILYAVFSLKARIWIVGDNPLILPL